MEANKTPLVTNLFLTSSQRTRKWQGVSGLGESVNTLDVFANDAYALARECSGWPYNFVVGLRGLDFNRDAYTGASSRTHMRPLCFEAFQAVVPDHLRYNTRETDEPVVNPTLERLTDAFGAFPPRAKQFRYSLRISDRLKLCYYLTTNTWYERMGRDDILETTWFKVRFGRCCQRVVGKLVPLRTVTPLIKHTQCTRD